MRGACWLRGGGAAASLPETLIQTPLRLEASIPPVAIGYGHSHLGQLLSCGFLQMPQDSEVPSHLLMSHKALFSLQMLFASGAIFSSFFSLSSLPFTIYLVLVLHLNEPFLKVLWAGTKVLRSLQCCWRNGAYTQAYLVLWSFAILHFTDVSFFFINWK